MKTNLDSIVDRAAIDYILNPGSNGLSIGIWYHGIKYAYNYGETVSGSGILPTVHTFYNLGSVAKPFISLILAEAVTESKVKILDDIRKYLPGDFPNLQYQGYPVRLIDLANHTSGLPKEFHDFSHLALDSISQLGVSAQVEYFNTYSRDTLLADLRKITPDTIPGTQFRYNGNATMLLMLLIEQIYRQPYEEIITSYLRKNFSMNDTKPVLSENEINRMAQGYSDGDLPQQYVNYTGYTGGPSMNSTTNDMLMFIEANINEQNQAIKLTHQLTWGDDNGFAMGLGWMMNTDTFSERFIYHDGHTIGGFNTHCILYPKQGLGFIIMVNDIMDQNKVTKLEQMIYTELRQKPD